MGAKILAGLVAALLVTGVGVYVASSGDSGAGRTGDETLPVSEGACCTLKMKLACTGADVCPAQTESTGPSDALAACTGSAAMAVSPKACPAVCCAED